jgi:hypothetical protein
MKNSGIFIHKNRWNGGNNVDKREELFKVGQEIISVQYETEGQDEFTWFFGGYINEETIAINVVSSKCSSQFFFRIKVGDEITLPELMFEDNETIKYKVVSMSPNKNQIILLEI